MTKKYQSVSFGGKPFLFETKSAESATMGAETKFDLETHQYQFEVKALRDENEDYYIIEGYATKWFGIDTYGDQIRPGAYAETLAKNSNGLPAFFMHRSQDMPVGLFFEMKEDETGLFVRCRLPKADTFITDRLVPQIKCGSIDALSIGFRPTKVSFEEIEGEMVRVLEGIDLKEISFITKGYQADSGALLTDLKKKGDRSSEELMFNAMVEAKRKGASDEHKQEIIEFYSQKDKANPFEDGAVISIEELKNLSKSNRTFAIQKLALSAKSANHLAELMEVPKNPQASGSEGVEDSSDVDTEGKEETPTDLESQIDGTGEESGTEEKAEEAISDALGDLIAEMKNTKQSFKTKGDRNV